jgi:pectin methylesterase-like acyl-CoA thioesterase
MKKTFTSLLLAVLLSLNSFAVTWVTVDPNIAASDENNLIFKTITEAVNMVVATGLDEQVPIFIKNGTYNECVRIGNKNSTPSFKLSLIGESRDGVIWQSNAVVGTKVLWPDVAADSIWVDRYYSAPLYVNGKGDGTSVFYAENITFKNFASAANADADAIYMRDIDGFAFKNCHFMSNKYVVDYKKQRRSMFYNCLFEGKTRLIKGGGTSMLYKCEMKLVADSGFVAEPEDNLFGNVSLTGNGDTVLYSYILRECKLTKKDGLMTATSYIANPLGNTKDSHAACILVDSKIDNHINPVGWILKDDFFNKWSYFAEYNSMNIDGTPADVSGRGNYGVQMDKKDVDSLLCLNLVYKMNNIIQKTGNKYAKMFRPDSMVCPPAAPKSVAVAGGKVTWDAVNGAIGYVVFRDGNFAGFATGNSYTDATPGTKYTVKAYNIFGAQSLESGSTEVEMTQIEMYNKLFKGPNEGKPNAINNPVAGKFGFTFNNGTFRTVNSFDFKVYNLSGRMLKQVNQSNEVNISDMPKGIYMIKAVDAQNSSYVTKVVL